MIRRLIIGGAAFAVLMLAAVAVRDSTEAGSIAPLSTKASVGTDGHVVRDQWGTPIFHTVYAGGYVYYHGPSGYILMRCRLSDWWCVYY